MSGGMTATAEERKRDGQRVLVLWLCWLALAVFLVAAGVVAAR